MIRKTVLNFCIGLLAILMANNAAAQNQPCQNDKIIMEINIARQYYKAKHYNEVITGTNSFFSANEYREFIDLKAGKSYIFIFKTEKLIDQTSLSLLNSYNIVVQSIFRETGQERSSIIMEYRPNFTGTYTMVLKTVDYTGRSVCGSWIVLEK